MKKEIISKAIIILLATSLFTACGPTADHDLIISNVNIIDMKTGEILEGRTIGIDSNRISRIYDEKIRSAARAETIDGKGGYLIPGLWDMHTHIHWNEKESSRLLLANGVTGIREMWGEMDSIKNFRNRNKEGYLAPDIYSAGRIIDGKPSVWEGSAEVMTAAEARAEVLRQIEEGADFVKVYSKLNKEAFDAIAEAAREKGIPFAGHVPNEISIFHAARMGMASSEHMFGVLPGVSTASDTLVKSQRTDEYRYIDTFSEKRFDSLCQTLIASNSWLCPTLTVNKVFTRLHDQEYLSNTDRMDYINPFLTNLWTSYTQDSAKSAQELQAYNFLLPLLGRAHAKGVRILAGTDFPNPYTFPGFAMHDELALLVESGMSELSALQAATSAAAEFMNKTRDFGTVEEGKIASLVLLRDNPLTDITYTQSIEAVVQRGVLYDRARLDELLSSVKEEIANATPTYSQLFKQLMGDIGFQAALDSVTVMISAGNTDYLLDPNDMGLVLGDLYEDEDTEKMARYAGYLVRWFPESSSVHTWAGEVMSMNQDTEAARALFEKALELDPENSRAKDNLEQLK